MTLDVEAVLVFAKRLAMAWIAVTCVPVIIFAADLARWAYEISIPASAWMKVEQAHVEDHKAGTGGMVVTIKRAMHRNAYGYWRAEVHAKDGSFTCPSSDGRAAYQIREISTKTYTIADYIGRSNCIKKLGEYRISILISLRPYEEHWPTSSIVKAVEFDTNWFRGTE